MISGVGSVLLGLVYRIAVKISLPHAPWRKLFQFFDFASRTALKKAFLKVVNISLTVAQPVPFLDRLILGQALTKARLQECKKGTPFPEAVVLVELHPLPSRSIPIDINMDVLILFLRFSFKEGND